MIGYLVVGLLFVLVLVFTILAWKQWHWTNSIFLILSFIAAVASVSGASKVMLSRSQAIKSELDSAKQLAQLEADLDTEIYGGNDQTSYGANSLRGLSEALELQRTRRGRVWSNVNASVNGDGTAVLDLADAAAEGAEAAPPENSSTELTGIVLYAFANTIENEGTVEQITIPSTFLGTIRVRTHNGNQLDIAPLFVIKEQEFSAGGSWTLYERMPGDRYNVFLEANDIVRKDLQIEAYRELLTGLFPKENVVDVNDPNAEEKYEAFIDQFSFTDFRLGDIENYIDRNQDTRINKRFQPEPEELFVKYKFNKKSNSEYAVDGSGRIDVDGPYSLSGEANDKTLQAGTKVAFEAGDEVLIDSTTASGYQLNNDTRILPFSQREDVTEVDRIYRRRLNDFPVLFADLRRQEQDLAARAASEASKNEKRINAVNEALQQRNIRDDVTLRLQQDNQNLKKDVEVINLALADRQQQLDDMEARMTALEEKIEQLRRARAGTQ